MAHPFLSQLLHKFLMLNFSGPRFLSSATLMERKIFTEFFFIIQPQQKRSRWHRRSTTRASASVSASRSNRLTEKVSKLISDVNNLLKLTRIYLSFQLGLCPNGSSKKGGKLRKCWWRFGGIKTEAFSCWSGSWQKKSLQLFNCAERVSTPQNYDGGRDNPLECLTIFCFPFLRFSAGVIFQVFDIYRMAHKESSARTYVDVAVNWQHLSLGG